MRADLRPKCELAHEAAAKEQELGLRERVKYNEYVPDHRSSCTHSLPWETVFHPLHPDRDMHQF